MKYVYQVPPEMWAHVIGEPDRAKAEAMFEHMPDFEYEFDDSDVLTASNLISMIVQPSYCRSQAFVTNLPEAPEISWMDDGSPVPETVFEDFSAATAKVAYWHEWQRNDLLLFNNTRVMHARENVRRSTPANPDSHWQLG
jgi:hypothetical protein